MIIDNLSQLESLSNRELFLFPVSKDNRLHNNCNPIIAHIIIDINTKETFTIPVSHPEGVINITDLSFLNKNKVYCYNLISYKYAGFNTNNFIDTKMQYYLCTNQGYEQQPANVILHYTRHFQNCYKVNELVSLVKHEEIAMSILDTILVKDPQPGLEFYQKSLLEVFYTIEKNGLRIKTSSFEDRFDHSFSRNGEFSFTEYNYYTTTGRPSNRFGGINFAALNKEDNTRDCFINRNGALVEIDFNSYHPRLIASIVGYDFGKDNVYEHLAQYYKESPEKAKELTFRQLYGGIQKQYLHIPFFEATNNLAQVLWNDANEKGYIESPISGRRLVLSNYQDVNCYTMFNYFIQMYETEHNVILLSKLFKTLDKNILPVLYTYDSILFDLPLTKIETLKSALDQAIPANFPYKLKIGTNYGCLS